METTVLTNEGMIFNFSLELDLFIKGLTYRARTCIAVFVERKLNERSGNVRDVTQSAERYLGLARVTKRIQNEPRNSRERLFKMRQTHV